MRYVFVGQNIMGGCALTALLVAGMPPLLAITREPSDYPNPVHDQAVAHQVPLVTTTHVNSARGLIDHLARLRPDVIVCCGWGDRIRPLLLRLPLRGWINLHPSYLPAYRGPSPIEWQIANGEQYAGGTAHYMDEDFDTGNVIVQDRVPILPSDNGEALRARCGALLGRLAVQSLGIVAADPANVGIPQDETRASSFPRRPDAWRIDCRMSAARLRDMVRGLAPFPCAVLRFRGQDMRVGEVRVTPRRTRSGDVGRVVLSAQGELLIGAADRWVAVVTRRVGSRLVADGEEVAEWETAVRSAGSTCASGA